MLFDKRNGKEFRLRAHYGDLTCGLIDEENKFCIVGGEGLSSFFFETNKEHNFLDNKCIHSMKQNNDNSIKILIDPWSNDPGVWILDIVTLSISKISSTPDLRDLPFQEYIDY